jgi:futalosine hydrolase
MINKILYTTSTSIEADAFIKMSGLEAHRTGYRYGKMNIELLVTGVGAVATAWKMSKWLSLNEHPCLVINAGIAGSFNPDIKIGDVVMPIFDCFADAGVEDGDNFFTLSEAGIVLGNDFPFKNDFIYCDNSYCKNLEPVVKPVRAITVNTATGSEATKERLMSKFDADIETMEGAAFFYVASLEKIPFIAVRSISNMVERRDKTKWNIPLVLNNLTIKLNEVFETLAQL